MNRIILILSFLILYTSCGSVSYMKNFLKERIEVQVAVNWKEEMDETNNVRIIQKSAERSRVKIYQFPIVVKFLNMNPKMFQILNLLFLRLKNCTIKVINLKS